MMVRDGENCRDTFDSGVNRRRSITMRKLGRIEIQSAAAVFMYRRRRPNSAARDRAVTWRAASFRRPATHIESLVLRRLTLGGLGARRRRLIVAASSFTETTGEDVLRGGVMTSDGGAVQGARAIARAMTSVLPA